MVLAIWNAKVWLGSKSAQYHNLIVFKGQRIRMLHVPILRESPALGITLQWTPLSTTEDVWHVLDVIPDSPADKAGLLPYGDYIIGTPEGLVHGESGLGELVEDYLSRPLRLYVYNHEYAVTRLVTITPSRHWGGNGALGCVLGFGALHRLPLPLAEPPAEPGDTLFETARFSNEEARLGQGQAQTHPGNMAVYPPTQGQPSGGLLVPATMSTPPPPGGATAFTPRPARNKRHGVSPNRAFDEYFQEGEQKSKQEDFTPSTKATPPPPPPKTGAVHGATKDPKPIAANEEHDP